MSPSRVLAVVLLAAASASPAARAQSCLSTPNNWSSYTYAGSGDLVTEVQVEHNPGGSPPVRAQNNVAFGVVWSKVVSSAIANAAIPGNYTLGHIRLRAHTIFAPPCPAPGAGSGVGGANTSRIDFAYAVDGNLVPPTFNNIVIPASAVSVNGNAVDVDVLIDPLSMGVSGNQLAWRALFATGVLGCQPEVNSLTIDYLALPNAIYQNTDPIPVGNVVLRTTWETPANAYPDRTVRGHLTAKLLYDVDTSPLTDYSDPLGPAPPNAWPVADAALRITYGNPPVNPFTPDSRSIVYNGGLGSMLSFLPGVALAQKILAPGVRATTFPGPTLLYDFDGSSLVNDTDGNWLVNWVRGWANGTTRTLNKSWGLGPIMRSTPAVAGPPGNPWWLLGGNTPAGERNLYGTPCTTIANSYVSQWDSRNAQVLVGSMDGLIHSFDLGSFRWCDDPSTSIEETHGWFFQAGARNYGTGSERWAYAPQGLMDSYRDNPPRSLPYQTAGGPPRASADASISVADVCLPPAPALFPAGPAPTCTFKTVAVAAETRNHPYVTAIDITNPAAAPTPLWAVDWPPAAEMDTTFQGMEYSPSVGPVLTRADGRRWQAAVSSGIGSVPGNVYLYLIDLITGGTYQSGGVRDSFGRVQLNVSSATVDCSAPAYGSAGAPVMVDSDQDGVVDRIYLVDTKGCLYKVNTSTMAVCPLASLGESVWAPIAVTTPDDVSGRVEIFVAGGDNPDALDYVVGQPHFHLFGIEDDDVGATCGVPKSLFTVDLTPATAGPGVVHKVWTAPAVNNDTVYVSTSVGDLNTPCWSDPNNPGLLLGYSLTSTLTGVPLLLLNQSLGGNATGGVHIYDGHIFANAQNATTTVVGRPSSWGYQSPGNARSGALLTNPVWYEH